ncbi:restriction endonuclease [Methanobacterium formicicum]|uniref:Restriction endonuclease n=1 Tax=Methanobacterium formicicum TaxID=2162 RepID=A0A843AL26_METFO|nr:restriction endonuclease [Methanobacterium formicicum]MBF4474516.1 restriction endonuclease [Methanobacterium formicicum]
MVRKGREAELILKELESFSLGDLAEIKSPDRILDVETGTKREVDVSIRCSVGTHNFLTVIECRDRKPPQDVTWIEQITGKTKAIKADKIIAVSTSGFTEGAKKKAEKNNIVLRTLEEFNAAETINWLKNITVNRPSFEIINVNLSLINTKKGDNIRPPELIKIEIKAHEKILFSESSGEHISFSDIIRFANEQKQNFLFHDLKIDDKPVMKNLTIKMGDKVYIDIKNEKYYIDIIDAVLDCRIKSEIVPLQKALRYKEKDNPLMDKMDYYFPFEDKEVTFTRIMDHETGRNKFKTDINDFK